MQIKMISKDKFEIKTKNSVVITSPEVKINDVKLLGPGEYEVGGIEVFGFDNNIYIFHIENIALGYLADITAPLSQEEMEGLSEIEILILPVSAGEKLELKQALDVIKMIDPKIIIPAKSDDNSAFCEAMGSCQEPVDIYKITKQQLMSMEGQTAIQLKS
jgi:hypothetical protein